MKLQHFLAVATFGIAVAANAQIAGMNMPAAKASAPASTKLTEGIAQKVDAATGMVTLKHGPIENLGMPGMTMMFPVSDKKMLAGIKDGEQVRFRAENVKGTIVVTRIEVAR